MQQLYSAYKANLDKNCKIFQPEPKRPKIQNIFAILDKCGICTYLIYKFYITSQNGFWTKKKKDKKDKCYHLASRMLSFGSAFNRYRETGSWIKKGLTETGHFDQFQRSCSDWSEKRRMQKSRSQCDVVRFVEKLQLLEKVSKQWL